MEVKIKSEDLLKSLKIIKGVVDNVKVKLESNNFINLVSNKNKLYLMGLGENRIISVEVATFDEEIKPINYSINFKQLQKSISVIGSKNLPEDILLLIESENKLDILINKLKLSLVNNVVPSMDEEISLLEITQQGNNYESAGYLNILTMLRGLTKTASQSDVIICSDGYSYTEDDMTMVSRLEYDFDKTHLLDSNSVKTILDILKESNKDSEINIEIDLNKGKYKLELDNMIYILYNYNFYFNENIPEIFQEFEVTETVTVNYEDFIKNLKLAEVYLKNGDDAVITISSDEIIIINGDAYEDEILGNKVEDSFSESKMEAESSIDDLTISIPLNKTLTTLGNLRDTAKLDKLTLELGLNDLEAVYFKHDLGGTLLGISLL